MTCVAPRIVNSVSCVKRIDQESFFVAGAVFGEVAVSIFVAGAIFREIWNDSRSAKRCIFQYKMLALSAKSSLGCGAGCGLTPWRFHGRIMVGSFSDRSRIVNDVSSVFTKFLSHIGRLFFVAGAIFGEVRP